MIMTAILLSTTLPLEQIQGKSVTVMDKAGHKIKAHLEVLVLNEVGKIAVQAWYNPSPDAQKVVLAAFYLTQEQMDDFAKNGKSCVLIAPYKISD
jgi:hypothetical protein